MWSAKKSEFAACPHTTCELNYEHQQARELQIRIILSLARKFLIRLETRGRLCVNMTSVLTTHVLFAFLDQSDDSEDCIWKAWVQGQLASLNKTIHPDRCRFWSRKLSAATVLPRCSKNSRTSEFLGKRQLTFVPAHKDHNWSTLAFENQPLDRDSQEYTRDQWNNVCSIFCHIRLTRNRQTKINQARTTWQKRCCPASNRNAPNGSHGDDSGRPPSRLRFHASWCVVPSSHQICSFHAAVKRTRRTPNTSCASTPTDWDAQNWTTHWLRAQKNQNVSVCSFSQQTACRIKIPLHAAFLPLLHIWVRSIECLLVPTSAAQTWGKKGEKKTPRENCLQKKFFSGQALGTPRRKKTTQKTREISLCFESFFSFHFQDFLVLRKKGFSPIFRKKKPRTQTSRIIFLKNWQLWCPPNPERVNACEKLQPVVYAFRNNQERHNRLGSRVWRRYQPDSNTRPSSQRERMWNNLVMSPQIAISSHSRKRKNHWSYSITTPMFLQLAKIVHRSFKLPALIAKLLVSLKKRICRAPQRPHHWRMWVVWRSKCNKLQQAFSIPCHDWSNVSCRLSWRLLWQFRFDPTTNKS